MKWPWRRSKDVSPEIADLGEAVQRSVAHADRDLVSAHSLARHAYAMADRLDAITAANGFGDYVLRSVAARGEEER